MSRTACVFTSATLGLAAWATSLGLIPVVASADPSRLTPSSSASAGPAKRAESHGTVLHIGDSFLDAGLEQALRPMFAEHGTRYFSHARTRAWLSTWSDDRHFDTTYASYSPSLILVTLGANEMVDPRPEGRSVLVRRLVRRFRGTPCVWIGHPLWKGVGPGLMDVIRRSCAPCRFFDSVPLSDSISRQRDHIHPNPEGGALWARAVFDWLLRERDPAKGYWGLKEAPVGEHGEPAEQDSGVTSAEAGD